MVSEGRPAPIRRLRRAELPTTCSLIGRLPEVNPFDVIVIAADAAGMMCATRFLAELPEKTVRALAEGLHDWQVKPSGTTGYQKAEVTVGGVDTRGLSSKTMEATAVPGLYFIGEVVDVTGWLGGFNFQWAWSSGVAAGRVV